MPASANTSASLSVNLGGSPWIVSAPKRAASVSHTHPRAPSCENTRTRFFPQYPHPMTATVVVKISLLEGVPVRRVSVWQRQTPSSWVTDVPMRQKSLSPTIIGSFPACKVSPAGREPAGFGRRRNGCRAREEDSSGCRGACGRAVDTLARTPWNRTRRERNHVVAFTSWSSKHTGGDFSSAPSNHGLNSGTISWSLRRSRSSGSLSSRSSCAMARRTSAKE